VSVVRPCIPCTALTLLAGSVQGPQGRERAVAPDGLRATGSVELPSQAPAGTLEALRWLPFGRALSQNRPPRPCRRVDDPRRRLDRCPRRQEGGAGCGSRSWELPTSRTHTASFSKAVSFRTDGARWMAKDPMNASLALGRRHEAHGRRRGQTRSEGRLGHALAACRGNQVTGRVYRTKQSCRLRGCGGGHAGTVRARPSTEHAPVARAAGVRDRAGISTLPTPSVPARPRATGATSAVTRPAGADELLHLKASHWPVAERAAGRGRPKRDQRSEETRTARWDGQHEADKAGGGSHRCCRIDSIPTSRTGPRTEITVAKSSRTDRSEAPW
jgi:hypothetical protein